jgi:hypothetical protein
MSERPITLGDVSTAATGASYVEWSAVLAGSAMAAALSFVLLTFGAAIGLSAVSPWSSTKASLAVVGSLAIFWTMAQQIGAAMAGGYVAGRMRQRWADTTKHEVEFRDGLHGGLVWAVSVIITAALLVSATGAVGRAGLGAAQATASAGMEQAGPMTYQIDQLLRPTVKDVQPAGAELKSEVGRLVTASLASGKLADADRDYLGAIVTQRTGLTPADASSRVTQFYAQASTAVKDAADKARKAGILVGFVTAASLLIAFAASWWAGVRGGHHRDNAVPASFAFARRT